MFDSKRSRGWLLAAILGVVVIAGLVTNTILSSRADAQAGRRQVEIRSLLAGPTPVSFADREQFIIDHHLSSLAGDSDQVLVTADAGSVWEARCVAGRRNQSGRITTEVLKRGCSGVRVQDVLPESSPS